MLDRCYSPKAKSYPFYGAKGIKVCERWHVFENFIADVGERPPGHTLDRKESTKDYSPDNCRWATQAVQDRHKFKMITFQGETLSLRDWAQRLGVSRVTLGFRLKRGWSLDRTLTFGDARRRAAANSRYSEGALS